MLDFFCKSRTKKINKYNFSIIFKLLKWNSSRLTSRKKKNLFIIVDKTSDVRLGFCNEIYGKKIVQRAEFS